MTTDIWVLGGTGRTGRGIAAALAARGVPAQLVGRDAARLQSAAADVGAAGTIVATSLDQTARAIRSGRPAFVVNTIGPFTTTAGPIAGACLDAGADYLDLANDLAAALDLFGLDDRAVAAGRTLVTGAGFGVTATESVVVALTDGRPTPTSVRVDMLPSIAVEPGPLGEALAGTILEGLPGIPGGGRYTSRRYEGGQLTRAAIGGDVVTFTTPDGDELRSGCVPLGELVAAQRVSGAPSVVSGSSEAPTSPAIRALFPLIGALLTIGPVRRFALRRLAAVKLKARPLPRTHSWGHATVHWPDGTEREGWLRLGNASDFTAEVAAEVATRLRAGSGRPGAFTPAALFGTELAEACGGEYMLGE